MYDVANGRAWLPELKAMAQEAGQLIITYFKQPERQEVSQKPDGTLVSAADIAANQLLVARLRELTPDIPVISEEEDVSVPVHDAAYNCYWLVDPLDGTRGFIDNLDEFCINIALVDNGKAVLGLIYVPVQQACFYALAGQGAFKQVAQQAPQRLPSKQRQAPYKIVVGHYHNAHRYEKYLNRLVDCSIHQVNSAYKFALVAAGEMDIYPRLGPTALWDTASGQIIIEETGGLVVDFNGQSLQYRLSQSRLNPKFLAIGDAGLLDETLSIFQNIRRK